MQISDEDVRRFQEAWKEEFGEEIDAEFARIRFNEVFELYRALDRFQRDLD